MKKFRRQHYRSLRISFCTFLLPIALLSQNTSECTLRKEISSKGILAAALLMDYLKEYDTTACDQAKELLDSIQIDIKKTNLQRLSISSTKDFKNIEQVIKIKETDFRKVLADEKKSQKERVNLESGEVFYWSKNNFMVLYVYIRILDKVMIDFGSCSKNKR
jgi:hypothetical protein